MSAGMTCERRASRPLRRARASTVRGALTAGIGLIALAASTATAQAGGTVTRTYTTEATQGTFVVPAGVEAIDVVAVGGAGASSSAASGGLGARVEGALSVTPGSTLYVEVGAKVT